MGKYIICVDASADLKEEFIKEHEIHCVPMQYSLGEDMRTSLGFEKDETIKMFYDGQRQGDMTKTTQITPFMYEEFFDEYLSKGYSVLYLALSSGLSSTYNSACLAAQNLKEKYPDVDLFPIDSLSATGGMNVLTEKMVENKAKGLSIEENRDDILNLVKHIHHWFFVQDLMYLKRGGRVGSATAMVGSLLGIKPVLEIDENGKLINISKKRGNKIAVMALIEYFKEFYDEKYCSVVYITDADCKDLSDFLKEELLKIYPTLVIKQTSLSPIIGAHTGPGALTLCHLGK